MKKVLAGTLVLMMILSVVIPSAMSSSDNQVQPLSKTALQTTIGGATPLGIIACSFIYAACLEKAGSWWERALCTAAALGCIAMT
jgi:hypothetical protein